MSAHSDPFRPASSQPGSLPGSAPGSLPLPPDAPDLSAARLHHSGWRADAAGLSADGAASGIVSPEASGQKRAPLVMAIDDSPAVRTIVEYSFARAGLKVITFADGLAAIRALLAQRLAVPDLVLLDIGLPRLDGYQVAAVLRTNEAFADVPILMLSGRDGIVDRVRSRMVGADTFIAKPFRPKQLVAIICEYLGIPPGDTRGSLPATNVRPGVRPSPMP